MNKHKCSFYVRQLWMLALIDFYSKIWVVKTFKYPVCMTPFFSFHVVYNRGISWSMFSSEDPFMFFLISFVAGAFLFFFAWYAYKRRKAGYCTYAETLVLVGGTANFIDRLYHGAVVDFIKLSWGTWFFPIFNIADVCIVLGVVFMMWQTYWTSEKE